MVNHAAKTANDVRLAGRRIDQGEQGGHAASGRRRSDETGCRQGSTNKPTERLFRKYALIFAILVSSVLLTSGGVELYFTYQESETALSRVEREQAVTVATRIEAVINTIIPQISLIVQDLRVIDPDGPDDKIADDNRYNRILYQRLLNHVPAITEVTYLDSRGREQLRIARGANGKVVGSLTDHSQEPEFLEPHSGDVYFSPVHYRTGSKPYLTIALPQSKPNVGVVGVTMAEVELGFIEDVVSDIQVGHAGYAYVVDSAGYLIAHPNFRLVTERTNLTTTPQLRVAQSQSGDREHVATVGMDLNGQAVLSASSAIEPLGWYAFVDQPLSEAYAPLYAAMLRTVVLLLLGIGLSIFASLLLARTMVRPIEALQLGAVRMGEGALDQRIEVRTGDELEILADEFNQMAARLRDYMADLQHSRERLVTAREEERRRLRRDLHDGLGPTLASLTLQLDAARNLLTRDPAAADALLADLKMQTSVAIADVRQVVYGLRPPTLDDLGLVAAIRQQGDRYHQLHGLRVSVDAPEDLPPLPAALEVAAYRIVAEALTNVVRHAQAHTCHIRLALSDTLTLEIMDDGVGVAIHHRAGVGLTSMRERAVELGGLCVVERAPTGGTRVFARLPLPKE